MIDLMPTYSKCLEPADYTYLNPELDCLRWNAQAMSGMIDLAHEHRFWEYALALRAVLRSGARTVLDVGGGAGWFSPVAAKCRLDVTHLDVGDFSALARNQGERIGVSWRHITADFLSWTPDRTYDAVVCLSVLEHIPDDQQFFRKLIATSRRMLVITTDFHDSGQRLVDGHLRTNNAASMQRFAAIARDNYFLPWGGKPDWTYHGDQVYNYTFASLVVEGMP